MLTFILTSPHNFKFTYINKKPIIEQTKFQCVPAVMTSYQNKPQQKLLLTEYQKKWHLTNHIDFSNKVCYCNIKHIFFIRNIVILNLVFYIHNLYRCLPSVPLENLCFKFHFISRGFLRNVNS